jgi:hypothetical protein
MHPNPMLARELAEGRIADIASSARSAGARRPARRRRAGIAWLAPRIAEAVVRLAGRIRVRLGFRRADRPARVPVR